MTFEIIKFCLKLPCVLVAIHNKIKMKIQAVKNTKQNNRSSKS